MKRREFIAALGGIAIAWPFAARAQQARTARIGILNFQNREPNLTLLREALRGLGYSEGKNLQFEFRSAEGNPGLLAGLAAELVLLKVDVIIAYPTPAVAIAKQATRELPIVMLGAGDPVESGLVAGLTRPGGNVTGTSSTSAELGSKILEIIREMIPSVRRVAVLANATDPFTKTFLEQMRLGGQTLSLEIQIIMIGAADELDAAFAAMKDNATDAVIVQPSLPRKRAADLALRYRVPALAPSAAFVGEGGLAVYAASQAEMAQRSASITDKILKGSNPADLPVEQPTKFELIVNLKTAKALNITVPPSLLARADEVIE
jgi:putative tryptophan/tyrosine transport system substrate-binding protein